MFQTDNFTQYFSNLKYCICNIHLKTATKITGIILICKPDKSKNISRQVSLFPCQWGCECVCVCVCAREHFYRAPIMNNLSFISSITEMTSSTQTSFLLVQLHLLFPILGLMMSLYGIPVNTCQAFPEVHTYKHNLQVQESGCLWSCLEQ